MVSKMTDDEYLRFDPFSSDRDVDIRCRKVRIVKTRKEHACMSPTIRFHPMPPGTKARFESAVVEGEWKSYYTCLKCIDEWIEKYE